MAPSRAKKKHVRPAPRKKPAVRMLSTAQVPAAVQTMAAPSGPARFAAGKQLAVTAEKDPARVYPHFDALAALLDSDSKVVRWNALQIVARLAPADIEHKVDAQLDTVLAPIHGDNLISAANAIQGAGRIAQARPALLDRILPALLSVEHATYATPDRAPSTKDRAGPCRSGAQRFRAPRRRSRGMPNTC
jgi:hypothetical protein